MLVKDLSNSFNPVPKPKDIVKNVKKDTKSRVKNVIKKKSSKLAKLEKNRFSIITNNLEKCYFCELPREDLHEVFCGRNRQRSIKWGLVIPICRIHHRKITDDEKFNEVMEDIARNIFIKKYGKEKFLEEFK